MPTKKDADATAGVKLLKLFRKLMIDGRKHFQADLAKELHCSGQTIIRLTSEIESVIGIGLESGISDRKKWYRIRSVSRAHLGLEREELRYLAICRDLAGAVLPVQHLEHIDNTLMNLSVLMADCDFAHRDSIQGEQCAFFSKGKIDYTPHREHLDILTQAVEHQKIVLVRYKASGGATIKEHRFVPAKLVAMNNALYVLGATLLEDFSKVKYFSNFAVHRIQDAILLERSFRIDFPVINPQTFGLPWHEPKSFSIRFQEGKAADYVRERIWADEQRLEEIDEKEGGGLVLHVTTRSEPELMAWVRSFGDGVEVVS